MLMMEECVSLSLYLGHADDGGVCLSLYLGHADDGGVSRSLSLSLPGPC